MKLIATDLDGTLLNEKGEVSIENARAIKKAMDHGIQFVVATGKMPMIGAKNPNSKLGELHVRLFA